MSRPLEAAVVDNTRPDQVRLCEALDIDADRTASLVIEVTTGGAFVARWEGFAVLSDVQRAAVAAILGGVEP